MNNLHILKALGAALVAASFASFAACSSSSDSGNPTPQNHPDSGMMMMTGNDAGGGTDANSTPDANNGCQSDASNCNSCVTPAMDPLNACSSQTGNCIPFDDTRVPKDSSGNVPKVM
jgi:hypothetical protein